MSFRLVIVFCILNGVFAIVKVKAQGAYKPTGESPDSHKMPQWYDNAKIGLSMHWGVYSVPAWAPRENGISYAGWYGNRMHEKGNPT